MERISTMTGGRYFPGDLDVKSQVAAIQADLENQLIVGFLRPMNSQDGNPHKLELRVNRKDVRVSIQSQYYPANP